MCVSVGLDSMGEISPSSISIYYSILLDMQDLTFYCLVDIPNMIKTIDNIFKILMHCPAPFEHMLSRCWQLQFCSNAQ